MMFTLLENYYNDNKDKILVIYMSGSKSLSYINNPHDTDYIILYKKDISVKDINTDSYKKLIQDLKNQDPNANTVTFFYHRAYYWLTGESIKEDYSIQARHLPVYLYLCANNSSKILCGEDSLGVTKIDILKDPIKSRYIHDLKEFVNNAISNNNFYKKSLYHILTAIYIYKNNSYELSEEQINNINIAHDCNDEEKYNELYNWAIAELEKL